MVNRSSKAQAKNPIDEAGEYTSKEKSLITHEKNLPQNLPEHCRFEDAARDANVKIFYREYESKGLPLLSVGTDGDVWVQGSRVFYRSGDRWEWWKGTDSIITAARDRTLDGRHPFLPESYLYRTWTGEMRWLVRRSIVLKHPYETGQAPGRKLKRKASGQNHANAKRHKNAFESDSDSESSGTDCGFKNSAPRASESGATTSVPNPHQQPPSPVHASSSGSQPAAPSTDLSLHPNRPGPSRSQVSMSNLMRQPPAASTAVSNAVDVKVKPDTRPFGMIDLTEDFDGVVLEFISNLTTDASDRRVLRKNFKEMKAMSERDLDRLARLASQSPGGFKEFTFVQLNRDHPILFSMLASALWKRGRSVQVF